MADTLLQPILGLDNEFPETLYVLHHPATAKYGCYCHDGIHGLACFSSEGHAFRFAEWIELSGMQCLEVAFDEARQIAKNRPLPVVSLMLLDNMDNPMIHFIR